MSDEILRRALEHYETPLYVFDQQRLLKRIAYLRSLLPSRTRLCYAVKANTFVIPLLADSVDRLESCSPGETRICAQLGVSPEKLVISGVHKNEAMLREAFSLCGARGRYTVESLAQFTLLRNLAREANTTIHLLLRLSSGNQFGVDVQTIERMVDEASRDPQVDICGLQYFSGTQITSIKRLERELASLDAVATMLTEVYGCNLRELEYGPGLPVAYFNADEPDNEPEHLSALASLLEGLTFDGELILEIGRGVVASCGTYLTRVVDLKLTDGQRFAIVDGGKHQIAYYGGGLGLKNPPCHLVLPHVASDAGPSRGNKGSTVHLWNVCGSLCTASDMLGKQVPLDNLAVGGVFAFEQAGAYCATEGLALFLSRDLPRIVLVDTTGKVHLARDSFETAVLNAPKP
ncbi:MAG: alanine racemase [Gordonibacter sp.]|nr:alanine racemase [Gordonibacter sp.]